jgi:hypothetical protein
MELNMPIAIKSFIAEIDPPLEGGIRLYANHLEDRIDYTIGDTSGKFMTREELDSAFEVGVFDVYARELARGLLRVHRVALAA